MKARHETLLGMIREQEVFRYFPEEENITVIGDHLVKGVSAKILRSLLSAFIQNGRSEFEYREFKRDFEISAGQKNANFEVRFYRLEEKLKEECPTLWVEKTGRDRFSLVVNGPVEFKEA